MNLGSLEGTGLSRLPWGRVGEFVKDCVQEVRTKSKGLWVRRKERDIKPIKRKMENSREKKREKCSKL